MSARLPLTPPLRSRRGRPFTIREAGPDDAADLAQMLGDLSAETVARRYLTPCRLPAERARSEAERLVRGGQGRIVLVAQAQGVAAPIVAVAELAQEHDEPATAEGAIVVADAYQHEGIGRAVAEQMAEAADKAAISKVRATILGTNTAVRRLIASLGRPYTQRHWRGELHIEISA